MRSSCEECGHEGSQLEIHAATFAAIATTAPINFPIHFEGEPQPVPFTDCNRRNNWQTSQGFKSQHPGGAHFVFCDGSVHFLSENINYTTYQRLGDRRDGQPVGEV